VWRQLARCTSPRIASYCFGQSAFTPEMLRGAPDVVPQGGYPRGSQRPSGVAAATCVKFCHTPAMIRLVLVLFAAAGCIGNVAGNVVSTLSSDGGTLADGGTPQACTDQAAITVPCTCQGATQTAGYCCSNLWQSVACAVNSNGLLDPTLTTTWNPGILADAPTGQALGSDGLPVRNTACAGSPVAPSAASTLQALLNACSAGTVLTLQGGTFTIQATLVVPSGVVLRGQASSGANATILSLHSGANGPVVAIGPPGVYDQTCYANGYTGSVNLVADAVKETNTVKIAVGNSTFAPGDLALVDQPDTSMVQIGDCTYFKRVVGGKYHSISDRVEVAAVDTTTGILTLTTPLHWTYSASGGAQISKVGQPVTSWAGIEHLWLQNGNNPVPPVGSSYDGAYAGGVDITNAKYCWVKDVQTDGTIVGMSVTMTGTYRCVVRDSHFHNSKLYGFGVDNYGIVIRCGAADNLIENNIVRYLDIPINFSVSGGGNVVGYNYTDNAWTLDTQDDDAYQVTTLDEHCSFPHMELVEGNYSPHMGLTTTHGNAGYFTYFRNYISSQYASNPIVWAEAEVPQTANVEAFEFSAGDINISVVGNVLGSTTNASVGVPVDLGTGTVSKVYMDYSRNSGAIFELPGGATDISATSLWVTGNFDTVNQQTTWKSTTTSHTLPASLYYKQKPAWWPEGAAWPWAGPDLSPMVGTLPAQATSAAFNYETANDPTCTPDVNSYYCLCP
jgi:hypothetical protein